MDDHKIVLWFLVCSGILAALIAVFLNWLVEAYYGGHGTRPSAQVILVERLLAAFISGVALALATRGKF